MLLLRLLLNAIPIWLLIGAAAACGDNDGPSEQETAAVEALRATLEKVGTRNGQGFRDGFTAQGFEDFARHEWGVSASFDSAAGDLDDTVEQSIYVVGAVRVTGDSDSRVTVAVQEGTRANLAEDLFVLTPSRGQWLVDAFDPRIVSPTVPAGYEQVAVSVREYDIEARGGLPSLPQTTAFVIKNDGSLEHDIALLWLDERVPTEGFFFGAAEAFPPSLEWYGDIRIATGETARLIPRQPLQNRDGRYVLFCTLGERAPTHAQLGMLVELPAR